MFRVGHTRGRVPVLVHWTVPALSLFILGTGGRYILTAAAFVGAYLAMLLIHEAGHQWAAEWRRCRVVGIHIYPLHGTCRYELPETRFDDALIAWGGPAAQLIAALPFALFIKLVGSTVDPVDVIVAFLGVFSPIVALVNLLPIAPLDGRKAWLILPLAWQRLRRGRRESEPRTAMEAMERALRNAAGRRGRQR